MVVRLGDFGSLRPGLNGKSQEDAKSVTADVVYRQKLIFVPGQRLKNMMKQSGISRLVTGSEIVPDNEENPGGNESVFWQISCYSSLFLGIREHTGIVSKVLVGRWKGGLGHVNVIASLIFSGMTGSAVADASGLGIMEIEAMRKEGYDDGFSAAITAGSAVIGPIFPPSIPLVIYGVIAGASIGNLFLAGMVPGIILALALCIYVCYIANKRNYPSGRKYAGMEFIKMTVSAVPALLTPIILLMGIYTGIMTATEAGAVAALYALLISVFAYRSITLSELSDNA